MFDLSHLDRNPVDCQRSNREFLPAVYKKRFISLATFPSMATCLSLMVLNLTRLIMVCFARIFVLRKEYRSQKSLDLVLLYFYRLSSVYIKCHGSLVIAVIRRSQST